ncbi:MAG: hypothetical protein J4452_04015 [Candidatus Aenigmarchaeota archaeon]|nr:hypothetical protein [Candidatus Aenigmarchaeota archaeon]
MPDILREMHLLAISLEQRGFGSSEIMKSVGELHDKFVAEGNRIVPDFVAVTDQSGSNTIYKYGNGMSYFCGNGSKRHVTSDDYSAFEPIAKKYGLNLEYRGKYNTYYFKQKTSLFRNRTIATVGYWRVVISNPSFESSDLLAEDLVLTTENITGGKFILR